MVRCTKSTSNGRQDTRRWPGTHTVPGTGPVLWTTHLRADPSPKGAIWLGICVETTDADPSSIVADDRATTLVSFSELELESLIDAAITDTEISESDRAHLAKLARYVVDELLAAIDRPDPAEHPYRPRHPFVSRTVERRIVRRVCQCAASHAWSRYLDMAPRLPQNTIAARSVRAMICSQNVLVGVLDEYADLNAPSHRALRAQVLDRLLNGEPAGELAKRYSVRLASCYVVAALADGPEEHGLIDRLLYRADLFVATADDHHVLLMPAADGILRREAKELAQRILRGGNDSQAGSTIAVSIATEHPRVAVAGPGHDVGGSPDPTAQQRRTPGRHAADVPRTQSGPQTRVQGAAHPSQHPGLQVAPDPRAHRTGPHCAQGHPDTGGVAHRVAAHRNGRGVDLALGPVVAPTDLLSEPRPRVRALRGDVGDRAAAMFGNGLGHRVGGGDQVPCRPEQA
jgi:hypothetical protein